MYIHYNIYPYHIKTESSQALFKYKASEDKAITQLLILSGALECNLGFFVGFKFGK
jgi:hypothetical protein